MAAKNDNVRRLGAKNARSVRERILAAGEELFAEQSWEAVGVRTLVAAANVNLSALHYHFGSKEGLIREIFAACAEPVLQERARCLEEMRRRPTPPSLEEILEAYLRSSLGIDARHRPVTFMKLRARLGLALDDVSRNLLSNTFDESCRAFLVEIERALPEISPATLRWRFHFLLGTMVYTMGNVGRIQSITNGNCDPGDVDQAVQALIPFLAAGFRSGPSALSKKSAGTGRKGKKRAAKQGAKAAGRAKRKMRKR